MGGVIKSERDQDQSVWVACVDAFGELREVTWSKFCVLKVTKDALWRTVGSQTIASFLGYPQLVTDQKWSTKAHLSYPDFTFRTPLQGQLSLPLRLYHNCSNFSSTSSTSFSSLLQVLIPKSCHKTPLVDRHGSRDTTFA